MSETASIVRREIIPLLAPPLRDMLEGLGTSLLDRLEEIRLRRERPVMILTSEEEFILAEDGGLSKASSCPFILSADICGRTIQYVTSSSIYAVQDEIRQGFITIPGGHRIGIVGKVVTENGRVISMKDISGLNIRVARCIKGIADSVMPYILPAWDELPYNTLIVSPPKLGKTTLLRDIIRKLSDGPDSAEGMGRGLNVGLVDERSEIASCYRGVPRNDVGIRTDVLDCCPRVEGIRMLIRSMSPDVIATDELGSDEDVAAVRDALSAGVAIIATAHGGMKGSGSLRPFMRPLIEERIFERVILLGRSLGIGTVESITEGIGGRELLGSPIKLMQCRESPSRRTPASVYGIGRKNRRGEIWDASL